MCYRIFLQLLRSSRQTYGEISVTPGQVKDAGSNAGLNRHNHYLLDMRQKSMTVQFMRNCCPPPTSRQRTKVSDRTNRTPSTRVVYVLRAKCARTRRADMSGYLPLFATSKAGVDGPETGNVDGKAIRTDLERAVTSPAVR